MPTITGNSKANVITGTRRDDSIFGLAGNDKLFGLAGNDTLYGGFGNNKNGSGADQLRGGGGNDFLDGEDGNDTLQGDRGNDLIVAGRGNDEIDGGSGNDLVMAAGTLDQYTFSFSSGALRMTDGLAARDGRDRVKHVETISFGDGYVLDLTGGNNDPYAVADTAETTEQTPVLIDVLANDFDPDTTIFGRGSTLSIVSIETTTNGGSATISDGKILYDPGSAFDSLGAGQTATDTFDYTINDGKGGSWTTSVNVAITGTGPAATIDLSTLNGSNGFRLDGAAEGDESGFSVASAGDINGDGFDDLVIGARYADPNGTSSGASYVVFGTAAGFASTFALSTLDGTNGFRMDGLQSYDFFGYSVASAGDVNGDGFHDLIIGAPRADQGGLGSGSSYVVYGKAGGFSATLDLSSLDGKTGFQIVGAASYDESGHSVASAGDVNGDGLDDLVIGAPSADPGGNFSGASYVVFGRAGGFASTLDLATLDGVTGFRLDGTTSYDFSGWSVATAGDVNGDGFHDWIVGAINVDSYSGASYVVFGRPGGGASTIDLSSLDGATGFRLDGAAPLDRSGWSVASAGDVNGDGLDDLIVGAYGADPAGSYSGSSYVVFGHAGGFASTLDLSSLNGATGFRLDGESSLDESGRSVSSAGDVNGDGFDDLIVGARGADPNGSNSGASYIVFGHAGGFASTLDLSSLDGVSGFRLDGASRPDQSGWSVASAGDVNGDGFDDLIIGAPGASPDDGYSGASYVVLGGNFIGSVVHLGTGGADTLTGTSAAETFVGGQGADTLIGKGGADAFQGGEGNDTMVVSNLTFFEVSGGHGEDTLKLDGTGLNLDLTTIPPSRIDSIERIDITGTGNNTLTLSILDVLDLSGESNTLRVDGDAGDAVVRGSGWTQATSGGSNGDGTSTIDGQTYQYYTAGQATLLVDTDIAVPVA